MTTRAEIDLLYGPPLQCIADCIRGFLIAKPGHDLLAADWSAIEARIAAWISNETRVLEIFKTHGKIYEDMASIIYQVPAEEITE